MTNKEFFIKTLESEKDKFRMAIDALPEDKHTHKVHDKSRDAASLASQLAVQWAAMSQIVKTGKIGWENDGGLKTKADMLAAFDKNITQLLADVKAADD